MHTLRNSLIPVVTFLGIDLGALMGGAIVTEGIFNIPGVGELHLPSIVQQGRHLGGRLRHRAGADLPAGEPVVDLLYGVLDPRIRYD